MRYSAVIPTFYITVLGVLILLVQYEARVHLNKPVKDIIIFIEYSEKFSILLQS